VTATLLNCIVVEQTAMIQSSWPGAVQFKLFTENVIAVQTIIQRKITNGCKIFEIAEQASLLKTARAVRELHI
jgi:hypothetical protein